MADIYLQYGCAYHAPEGWINFDASPTLRFERIPVLGRLYTPNDKRFPLSVRFGDIVSGLPIESGSCKAVYASHVLEHLCLDDGRAALRETRRILAEGGLFRVVVPDLRILADRFAASDRTDDQACMSFMMDSLLGTAERGQSVLARARRLFGKSQHLWMWDQPSLEAELRRAGFSLTRRAYFGDSSDPMFSAVEDPLRFEDACAIEAS